MPANYDASQVGVPFVRVDKITIHYPDNGVLPWAVIEQTLAVKLADGTVRTIEKLPSLQSTFDLANDGSDPIPLVSPETGAQLGPSTTLTGVMLNILAVVRKVQLGG